MSQPEDTNQDSLSEAPGTAQFDVFISYSTSDAEYARWVREQLERHGLKVFVAHEDLNLRVGSEEWSKAIDDALDASRALILLVTLQSLSSRWVQYEWRSVHNDILANRGGMLIPVCVEGPGCPDLPRALRRYQCVDLRNKQGRESSISAVLDLLRGHAEQSGAPASLRAESTLSRFSFSRRLGGIILVSAVLILAAMAWGFLKYRNSLHSSPPVAPLEDESKKPKQAISGNTSVAQVPGKSLGVLIVPIALHGHPKVKVEDLRREIFGPWETGSLTDYFKEVSRGQLTLSIQVLDWVEPPSPAVQPRAQDFDGWSKLFRSVLKKIDPQVSMDQLDLNADGAVDLVVFVPDCMWAGSAPDDRTVWPISWSFASSHLPAYHSEDRRNNEPIVVDDFAILPFFQTDRAMIEIGPFVRKIGIALGLQAQEQGQRNAKHTVEGVWSPMGTGSWGANGRSAFRPTHFSGAEKFILGWVTAKEELGSLVQLAPIQEGGEVVRVNMGEGRFLVLENRRRQGFDREIPGEGLLIWQVSGSQIQLLEADGRQDLAENGGEVSDLFPQPDKSSLLVGGVRLRKIRTGDGNTILFTLDRLEDG